MLICASAACSKVSTGGKRSSYNLLLPKVHQSRFPGNALSLLLAGDTRPRVEVFLVPRHSLPYVAIVRLQQRLWQSTLRDPRHSMHLRHYCWMSLARLYKRLPVTSVRVEASYDQSLESSVMTNIRRDETHRQVFRHLQDIDAVKRALVANTSRLHLEPLHYLHRQKLHAGRH
jgi:hypothetical protein